jgi:8-oxo-dGTP pyrophosphatase MutT (NUDIX family)
MAKVIAAGIFIIRRDNRVLICHPTNHKDTLWSIPKGKVEEGEGLIDAALRETFEETNLDLKTKIAVSSFHVHNLEAVTYGHKKKMIHPFVYIEHSFSEMDWNALEIKCNSNVPLDRGGFPEMDEYKWVSIDEARKLLHETQVACLDDINKLLSYYEPTI